MIIQWAYLSLCWEFSLLCCLRARWLWGRPGRVWDRTASSSHHKTPPALPPGWHWQRCRSSPPAADGIEGTSWPLWKAHAWLWSTWPPGGTPTWESCRLAEGSPLGCWGASSASPIVLLRRAWEAWSRQQIRSFSQTGNYQMSDVNQLRERKNRDYIRSTDLCTIMQNACGKYLTHVMMELHSDSM